jgi:hypothetical protein
VVTYVLIDTNILAERTRILRTGLGPSLVYFAKVRDAKVFLPQIIEQEVRRYVTKQVAELSDDLSTTLRSLREWLGESVDPPLPTESVAVESLNTRFAELKKWIVPCQTTSELILRAAQRVLQKRAPSHRDGDDAFKDCLIWECVLSLPSGSAVEFVSGDQRAFFDPTAPDVLHPDLAKDAAALEISVVAHRDLESLVRKLQRVAPDLDQDRARFTLNTALGNAFIQAMSAWRIDEIGEETFQIDPFLTEHAGILHLEFAVRAIAPGHAEVDGVQYDSPSVRLQGSCLYDPHGPVRDLRVTKTSLLSGDGREIAATVTGYMSGAVHLGLPHRRFETRRRLGDITASAKPGSKPQRGQ